MRESKRLDQARRGRVNALRDHAQQRRVRDNLERRLAKNLKTLFRKFMNTEMYLFREYGVWDPNVAREHLEEDFIPLLTVHLRKLFQMVWTNEEAKVTQGKQMAVDVRVFRQQRDIVELVDRYFNGRALILANVTARMAQAIDDLIREGREEGISNYQIARNIRDTFPTIITARANLIARTETHNAAGYAADVYYDALRNVTGQIMMKKWVSTADERTREAHSEAGAGKPIPMDEDFIVGGAPMKYAGDPRGGLKNTINCRCTVVYVDQRDVVE